jgi:hypothetical protein
LGILSIVAIPALSGMREDAMIANERTKIATVRTGLTALRDKFLITGMEPRPMSGASYYAYNLRVEWAPGETYWVSLQSFSDSNCQDGIKGTTFPWSCLSKQLFPAALNMEAPESSSVPIEKAVKNGKYYPASTFLYPIDDDDPASHFIGAGGRSHPVGSIIKHGTLALLLPPHERTNVRAGNHHMSESVLGKRLDHPDIWLSSYNPSSHYRYTYILGEATMNITDPTKALCRGKFWRYDPGNGSITLVGKCLDN